jgi:hypothetical protein
MYLIVVGIVLFLIVIGALTYYLYNKQQVYVIESCQDFDLKLECPEGKVASFGNIQYGRWDNTVCKDSSVNPDTPPKYQIFPIKPGQVKARDTITVDPYPGVSKQYLVKYTCDTPKKVEEHVEEILKEGSPKCIADKTWSNTKPVSYGEKVTRKCVNGGIETATCGETGVWSISGCPQTCIVDSTWDKPGQLQVGGKVTRKCKDGKNQEATCLKNGELSVSVCDPVPEECIVTDWSPCNPDTMTQTRSKITDDKYGGFCPSLTQQCTSYIRSTYSPKCPDGTQQLGSECYKFPIGDYKVSSTEYIPKCPMDTVMSGNECKKTIIGYNPGNCKEGKLSGNMCVLNPYDRGNVYISQGIVGLGGTSGVTLCNKAHNGNCESSRLNKNDGYPMCATGYQVSSSSERTCVPIGANPAGIRELGIATCNPGDYTASNINACFSQPLPGYIHEEPHRDAVGNPLIVSKLIQKPVTADKIQAICNPGDSYAQDGSCFPQPKEGYTCSGNECKLKG